MRMHNLSFSEGCSHQGDVQKNGCNWRDACEGYSLCSLVISCKSGLEMLMNRR